MAKSRKDQPDGNQTDCPVIGSVENMTLDIGLDHDFDEECDYWCPECDHLFSCQKAWERWPHDELFREIHRIELEDMIDDTMQVSPTSDRPEVSDPQLSLQCEVVAPTDDLPPEIQRFLRDLHRLVRKTQKQLQKLAKK